ncbi:MAG: protein-L-isoaspartate O-methyltransferase family protein [Promethearchaeota archaeon]
MYEKKKEQLIKHLYEIDVLHDPRIEQAFLLVPLEEFIPPELTFDDLLYLDRPQLFYFRSHVDRRTISAPHMICIMLEYLNLQAEDDLLILGSKSGYIAAIASLLCSEGQVFVIESSEEILKFTKRNLLSTGFDSNITLLHGNPLTMAGTENFGKWNKILVPYQVQEHEIFPALRQLNDDGGVLFAPIGPEDFQFFTQIIRKGEKFYGNKISTVVFSPLEKNVTFLSQQVELLEFIKQVNKDASLNDDIMAEIEIAKRELENRKQKLDELTSTFKQMKIIYDSKEGDELFKQYIKESNIKQRAEEGLDFKFIEDMAYEMAFNNRGKIRLITISNRFGIPFDIVKYYLKKSKKGELSGNMNDKKSLKFVIKDDEIPKDPLVTAIFTELKSNFHIFREHLDDGNLPELRDLVDHYIEKVLFLQTEKKLSLKKMSLLLDKLDSTLYILEEKLNRSGEVSKTFQDKIRKTIIGLLNELEHQLVNF